MDKKVAVDTTRISGEDITRIADSIFGSAGDAYKQYMLTQMLQNKAQGKPIQVPKPYVDQEGLPRYVPWLLIGGVALAGVAIVAMRGRRRRPQWAGRAQIIDVTPRRLPG